MTDELIRKDEPQFNPFPGLRPFESNETHLFFGRDGQSNELIKRLARTRLLAVVGTSGSGKSSLVRAGLLPALNGGFMASAGSSWHVAVFRPGDNPVGNLAMALCSQTVLGSDNQDLATQVAIVEATLRRSALGIIEATRQARMRPNENLLIVVDQFEELFRFKQVATNSHSQDDAVAFVKLILEASRQVELPIYVVLTMRSEFLGDCAQFRDLPEALNDGQYLIPRMTRDERRAAIVGPAAVGGGEMTPRLVHRLLNDVGDNPDQLPILQHALMRTWDHWKQNQKNGEPIDLPDYEAIGGMSDALSRHADDAYDKLPDARSKEIAEKLFKCLTEKGLNNREIRRPTKLREICAVANAEPNEVIPLIDAFRCAGRTFLMPPFPVALDEEFIIDISHESLIRQWERLNKWSEQETRSAETYRRLEQTARLWKNGQAALWTTPDLENALVWKEREKPTSTWSERYGKDFDIAMQFLDASQRTQEEERRRDEEARQHELAQARALAEAQERRAEAERQRADYQAKATRRLRHVAAGLVVVFLMATVAAAFAIRSAKRAEAERKRAENAEADVRAQKDTYQRLLNDSTTLISTLGNLTSNDPEEKSSAMDKLKNLAENGQFSDTQLLGAVQRIIEKTAPNLAAKTSEVIDKAISSNPPVIYIQIPDEGQRPRAEKIQAKLKEAGYVVPGIENVGGKARAPAKTELRYFRTSEENEANQVVDILKSLNVNIEPKYIPGFEKSKAVKPGTYELWLSPDSLK